MTVNVDRIVIWTFTFLATLRFSSSFSIFFYFDCLIELSEMILWSLYILAQNLPMSNIRRYWVISIRW